MQIDLLKYIPLLNIHIENEQTLIWCTIRKKKVVVTPEEIVRQTCIFFLINELHFSKNLIKVEYKFSKNTNDRLDICVFDTNAKPLLIAECKRADVELNDSVLQQITRYNQFVHAQKGLITNGVKTIIFDF